MRQSLRISSPTSLIESLRHLKVPTRPIRQPRWRIWPNLLFRNRPAIQADAQSIAVAIKRLASAIKCLAQNDKESLGRTPTMRVSGVSSQAIRGRCGAYRTGVSVRGAWVHIVAQFGIGHARWSKTSKLLGRIGIKLCPSPSHLRLPGRGGLIREKAHMRSCRCEWRSAAEAPSAPGHTGRTQGALPFSWPMRSGDKQ